MPPDKTYPRVLNAGAALHGMIRGFGMDEKVGQPVHTEITPSCGVRSPNRLPGINPVNPAPAIFKINDENLPKCGGCLGQYDNHNTGSYCRYGFNPADCQGPEKEDE